MCKPVASCIPFYRAQSFSVFLFCISDPYFKPSAFVSSLNPACIASVNVDVATVLRIRLIHAIRHASLQFAPLTYANHETLALDNVRLSAKRHPDEIAQDSEMLLFVCLINY